jgi:hypothetical protein
MILKRHFSVERLSKEFFQKYKETYEDFVEFLQVKAIQKKETIC